MSSTTTKMITVIAMKPPAAPTATEMVLRSVMDEGVGVMVVDVSDMECMVDVLDVNVSVLVAPVMR